MAEWEKITNEIPKSQFPMITEKTPRNFAEFLV